MKSYKSLKAGFLKDAEVRKNYDELAPEFAVIDLMIKKRLKRGLSQSALARKVGTKQSAISRFESGEYNPTLSFLNKVADALDAKMKITIS
ncbi:MAG TPA: helix-turn-helix transcriptional regulator [Patescibacteria group bacterium]|nr:helix-turn-helix transcriptional regulator [Patescibacteria group bacterium]